MKKQCRKCQKLKDTKDFHKNKGYEDGLSHICKQCKKDYRKMWYQRNKKRLNEESKRYLLSNPKIYNNLKYRFNNFTEDDYNNLFVEQNGCCAICGAHQSELSRRLAVDHNHETGHIRGLLCMKCNTALGKFYDSVEVLQNAIKYLQTRKG